MSPLHSHQSQVAGGEPLSDVDLQEISGGQLNLKALLIREVVCRQGVPLDVLQTNRFREMLARPFGR
jgi:hypothetical protein